MPEVRKKDFATSRLRFMSHTLVELLANLQSWKYFVWFKISEPSLRLNFSRMIEPFEQIIK